MERLYQKWEKYAYSNKIDPFKIIDVKSKLCCNFGAICQSYTACEKSKVLEHFFREHPNLLICQIDKSRNLEITTLEKYKSKIEEAFNDRQTFTKLTKNPLQSDKTKLFRSISKFKPHISKNTEFRTRPSDKLKRGYGVIKYHKPEKPLRPIISSINSVTEGAEIYLKKILSPFVSQCKFSVNIFLI